jgi:hypothetical protein
MSNMTYTKNTEVTKTFQSFNTLIHSTGVSMASTPKTFSWVDSKTGEKLPRWKQLVKNGASATTAFDGVKYDIRASRGRCFKKVLITNSKPPPPLFLGERHLDGYLCLPARMPQPVAIGGPALTTARNQAIARFLAQLQQQRTQMDGLTLMGELRESISLIRNSSRKLAQMIPKHVEIQAKWVRKYMGKTKISPHTGLPIPDNDSVKRLKRKPDLWKEFRKGLYDNYLTFAFGAKPLLHDVQDAAETLARFSYDSHHTEIKGYGKGIESISKTREVQFPAGEISALFTREVAVTMEVILRGGYRTQVSAPFGSARRLRDLVGFTPEQFVPSVWELLPFSFLVDYFFNVQEILQYAFTDTSDLTWLNETIISTRRDKGNLDADAVSDLVGGTLGSYEASARIVKRRIQSSFPVVKPEIKIPQLGSLKWLNIAALVGAGAMNRRPGLGSMF